MGFFTVKKITNLDQVKEGDRIEEDCILVINSPKYGRFEVLYSKEDEDLVLSKNWHVKKEYRTVDCFYVMTNIWINNKRTAISLHRFLKPEWKMIDHINGNPLDNRRVNLRETTYRQNSKNKTKRSLNAASKYRGVYKKQAKWAAKIMCDYKNYYLGAFETQEEAAKAYNEKALQFHGEYANLNIIENKE